MKKILLGVLLVSVLLLTAACERPSVTETAVPSGWLCEQLWPVAEPVKANEFPHFTCFDPTQC